MTDEQFYSYVILPSINYLILFIAFAILNDSNIKAMANIVYQSLVWDKPIDKQMEELKKYAEESGSLFFKLQISYYITLFFSPLLVIYIFLLVRYRMIKSEGK